MSATGVLLGDAPALSKAGVLLVALVEGADPLVEGGVVQCEKEWLDEPKLGTGVEPGTEQPNRGVKPGRCEGPREAEADCQSAEWRARPMT